jgi:hypothetical protein
MTTTTPNARTIRERFEAIPHRYLVLAVALAVFALSVLRNPSLWASQFVFEEAGAYWAMTFAQDPIRFLFDGWVGYLNVLSRMVFLAARVVSPEWAPAFTRLVESGIIAAVAAFFASERFGAWCRAGSRGSCSGCRWGCCRPPHRTARSSRPLGHRGVPGRPQRSS